MYWFLGYIPQGVGIDGAVDRYDHVLVIHLLSARARVGSSENFTLSIPWRGAED